MRGAQGAAGDVAQDEMVVGEGVLRRDGCGSRSVGEGSDEDEEAQILKRHLYSDF